MMETPISSDIMAVAALVSSLGSFLGVIVSLIVNLRNSRKIDDTHDIAKQTYFSNTGTHYVPSESKEG
jgi:hypothetical protein